MENTSIFTNFWNDNIVAYFQNLQNNPWLIISVALDLTIVIFLIYKLVTASKNSRIWQLLKGIIILVVLTLISEWLQLTIVHFLLSSVMTYGIIAIIVIFAPEIRRGLEELGTNKITKFFGFDKNLVASGKDDVYKVVIAAEELAKTKTGGLIVFENDIKLKDIAESGVEMNSDISPQLLVNIFVPNTPLHDGAVIIANGKIASAACILPLINDSSLPKRFGTRHRAALGISKETDAIAVVISEETGKISIAKEGHLIEDVQEEDLKKILIKNVVDDKYAYSEKAHNRANKIKSKIRKKK